MADIRNKVFKIKEKVWSLGGTFNIYDEDDNPLFEVKGKAFSWSDHLTFKNMEGEELAIIKQKKFAWKPEYSILKNDNEVVRLIKEFSWFKKKFTLDVPGPNDYTIKGSFWNHEFEFIRLDRMVAFVKKKKWGWKDSYGVQIEEGEDEVIILCSCIVIDLILAKSTSSWPTSRVQGVKKKEI